MVTFVVPAILTIHFTIRPWISASFPPLYIPPDISAVAAVTFPLASLVTFIVTETPLLCGFAERMVVMVEPVIFPFGSFCTTSVLWMVLPSSVFSVLTVVSVLEPSGFSVTVVTGFSGLDGLLGVSGAGVGVPVTPGVPVAPGVVVGTPGVPVAPGVVVGTLGVDVTVGVSLPLGVGAIVLPDAVTVIATTVFASFCAGFVRGPERRGSGPAV